MSAFVVSKEHIDALVRVAVDGPADGRGNWRVYRPTDAERPDALGARLLAENVTSVTYRYCDNRPEEMVPDYAKGPYRFNYRAPRLTIAQAFKALACYEYQSCEHPGWERSSMQRFCESLRQCLIGALPGYEEADWEIAS